MTSSFFSFEKWFNRPRLPTDMESRELRWIRVRVAMPIGTEFVYLGLILRVWGWHNDEGISRMRCEYVNQVSGKIDHHAFGLEEAEAIIAERANEN